MIPNISHFWDGNEFSITFFDYRTLRIKFHVERTESLTEKSSLWYR